jgi:hypothetical protein
MATKPKLETVENTLDALPKGLALLRLPFPPHQISKLPKESKAQREARQADRNLATNCQVCGGWHHKSAVHLDYVGHAALTDRLLDVDPHWSWEPVGFSPDGLPAIDPRFGGLWIKLTICGVSRYGFGAADGKTGGDAMKEMIGDALRNAAMRFGAALDLWHKGDLHAEDEPTNDNPTTGEAKANKRVEYKSLDGKNPPPYTCPTQLMTAAREFVRTLNGIADLDDFKAFGATQDTQDFLKQLKRDLPDWWKGGPSVTPDFVPIEILIAQKKRDLEQIAELNASEQAALAK